MNDTMTGSYAADPVDADLVATMRDVLASGAPTARSTETGIAFDAGLWARLSDLGLARLTGSESAGGSGAGWREAAALLTEAAGLAVSLPLAEHDLLAGWLLEEAGLPVDEALRTVAVLDEAGFARAVPWASAASRIVVAWPAGGSWNVAELAASDVAIAPGRNLVGEPRDDVRVDVGALPGTSVDAAVIDQLTVRAALARAIQVTGALERILELTLDHTTTRVQFGRSISKFQAVQHLVADIAAEVSLARSSVDAAVRAADSGDTGRLAFLTAVARSCTGHAASVTVRSGHQLHGAIGTTLEHELHRYTLAALSWRSEYGSTQSWDDRVAAYARGAGSAGLWPLITG